ncbi:hypothetical protein CDD82_662 [Ophiocordyceps australis]|uniref:Ribosomal protein S2 n=1 Tax=Ophiocordyceps australis TaxID=1399860 RepID=A0A2C5YMP7_9HYPO|nr:hypothetical protein CDD82_662 [Ophiocordyceps australis]
MTTQAVELAMHRCSLTLGQGHRVTVSARPWHGVRTLSGLDKTAAKTQRYGGDGMGSRLVPKPLLSTKRKQRRIAEGTMTLRADSVVKRQGGAWTKPHEFGDKKLSPAEQYIEYRRFRKQTQGLGSKVEQRYVPGELIANPAGPEDVTLEMLMAAQTHMGHCTSLWNPSNSRYIYGARQGIHIISLETTAAHLRRAARVVEGVSYNGGLILFTGTRKGQMEIVTMAAELSGGCHLFTKWIPGGITNRDVILQFKDIKVVNHMDHEIKGFEAYKNIARPLLPDLVVCLNPLENYVLLQECANKGIPTIGIIDTNVEPSWVTYTIPANDDSLRAVAVIAGVLGKAGQRGKDQRLREAAQGSVPWSTPEALRRHMRKEVLAALRKKQAAMAMAMNKDEEKEQGGEEDEHKLLRKRYDDEMFDVGDEEMLAILGKASMGGGPQDVGGGESRLREKE